MAISTTCRCGKGFTLADELAGRQVRCSQCRGVFVVPRRAVQAVPAGAARPAAGAAQSASRTPTPRPLKRSKEEVRAAVHAAMAASADTPTEDGSGGGPMHPVTKLVIGACVVILGAYGVSMCFWRSMTTPEKGAPASTCAAPSPQVDLNQLAAGLQDAEAARRLAAMQAMAAQGGMPPVPDPQIFAALEDPRPEVRDAAIAELERMSQRASAQGMQDFARAMEDPQVRAQMEAAMRGMGAEGQAALEELRRRSGR